MSQDALQRAATKHRYLNSKSHRWTENMLRINTRKKKLSNNMPKLHLAAISVSEWPQNATCGENKDRRKQKNRPARLTIEKSERVASCHDRRASVQTCDNGHVLLACFFEKNVWDFFFAHAHTKMLHCSQTVHHSPAKTRHKKNPSNIS